MFVSIFATYKNNWWWNKCRGGRKKWWWRDHCGTLRFFGRELKRREWYMKKYGLRARIQFKEDNDLHSLKIVPLYNHRPRVGKSGWKHLCATSGLKAAKRDNDYYHCTFAKKGYWRGVRRDDAAAGWAALEYVRQHFAKSRVVTLQVDRVLPNSLVVLKVTPMWQPAIHNVRFLREHFSPHPGLGDPAISM